MAYLSHKDLEKLGARVFRAYKQLPELQGQDIRRMDMELLAEKLCGLKIVYCHLSRHRDILGLTCAYDSVVEVADEDWNLYYYPIDGKTILIETHLREDDGQYGRFNFTVAHEIAHQLLDRLYPPMDPRVRQRIHYCMANQKQEYPIRDWYEWQANTLAAELLMPIEPLMRALSYCGIENGVKMLNKVFRPRDYDKFCKAATMLGVSKQALALRLKRLGLLGENYLDDPYKLVRVEV